MKIITNTAMSLDGKISVAKEKLFLMGSEEDRRRMSEIRALADAVLVGGNSFRNLPIPMLPRPEHRRDPGVRVWNVVVSRKMDFVLPARFLEEKMMRPLFFTPNAASSNAFPVEVVTMDPVTPAGIVAELAKRGVETLLVEAGGDLIAQFLDANLVDEMYVTVCPKIIGGTDAPSIVGGAGRGRDYMKALQLLSCRAVGDEVFLHYRTSK